MRGQLTLASGELIIQRRSGSSSMDDCGGGVCVSLGDSICADVGDPESGAASGGWVTSASRLRPSGHHRDPDSAAAAGKQFHPKIKMLTSASAECRIALRPPDVGQALPPDALCCQAAKA
jgi:hypothetical protein